MASNALDDVLTSLDVSGQVLLVDEYRPPWAIDIPAGEEVARALGIEGESRVVPFHIVRRGSFELCFEGGKPRVIRAGEVAICVGSQRHRMQEGGPDRAVPFLDLLETAMLPIGAGTGGSTELVCGVFALRRADRNPLIDALPAVVHTDVSGRNGGKTMELLTQLLVGELHMNRAGHGYMTSRFVELLCAESIRQYLDSHDHDEPGWFRAMRDPKVGPAINAIHAAPESALSVAALAANVSMSPSRFAARFRETLGEPVMAYVTRWRMNIARKLLAETDLPVEHVAMRSGYESAATFSRAFSRDVGTSPTQYRKQRAAE